MKEEWLEQGMGLGTFGPAALDGNNKLIT